MTDDLKLQMNTFMPLRDVVFQTLREAILKGELKPGERLMEIQLAQKLGVSRTPIREAIRMLELEGLACTVPRHGARVAKMTEKEMEDVLQIRLALDALAVELACEKITKKELDRLHRALMEFEYYTKTKDVNKLAQSDVAIHDVIYQATGNPRLIAILSQLREQMYRYRVEYLRDESTYPALIQEHKNIYNGLLRHDKDFVVKAICGHVTNQEMIMKHVIREQE